VRRVLTLDRTIGHYVARLAQHVRPGRVFKARQRPLSNRALRPDRIAGNGGHPLRIQSCSVCDRPWLAFTAKQATMRSVILAAPRTA